MNVLEKLNQELQERKDYTLEQKKRYLYLRTCQLFSYDRRYHFCTQELLGKKAKNLRDEIINKKVNLEDVSDFTVVCKKFSEDVFSPVLNKLLNSESKVENGGNHYWVEFDENNQTIKADATLGDLTRAKMGFVTYGYKPVIKDKSYKGKLKLIDKEIEYIKSDYENAFWISLMGQGYHNSLQATGLINYLNLLSSEELDTILNNKIREEAEILLESRRLLLSGLPKDLKDKFLCHDNSEEIIKIKLEKIKEALSNYHFLSQLDDKKYNLCSFEDTNIVIGDFFRKLSLLLPEISLFQDNNQKEWDFINIYPVHFNDCSLYYALEKEDNNYTFHEISKQRAKTYVKELNGINKEHFYHK